MSLQFQIKNNPYSIQCLDSILFTIYSLIHVRFDPNDSSVETLLPHLVFANKNGACLGVSLMILILAEKLHCPVYGVLLPGHFFCRYDDGRIRRNVEPNKNGFSHPDAYYKKRYINFDTSWYDLSNLTPYKTIGVLCYNAGALCLRRNAFPQAVGYLNESARRLPGYPDALGNLGIAYARNNRLDSAYMIFDALFSRYPNMPLLAENFGAVALALNRNSQALAIFQKGRMAFPDVQALIDGYQTAARRIGRPAGELSAARKHPGRSTNEHDSLNGGN
jgi:tetratricopeptide (TPR) repeat protein